ncbi:cation:dicarboxylate symporter family transporter [Frateuria defendens]|uniref:cation:dicarboxylate symporter family transporter n=1 Tax=Frateuria defendens TaxID=2219559 RepID=UPI00066FEBBD|nr:cation:dicarboxylase symporter family transporter [Frateuria defendens]
MRYLARSLFLQVVLAAVLGVLLGAFVPEFAKRLSPLAKDFIQLIKIMVGPVVFCVVACGIAKSGDLRRVGRLGGLALLYFEVVSTVALLFGVLVAFVVQPGRGLHASPAALAQLGEPPAAAHHELGGVADFFQRLIPDSLLSPFVQGDVLQILLLAIVTGVALILLGPPGEKIGHVIEDASRLFFRILGLFVRLAPLGVLGAMAYTTASFGLASLEKVGLLLLAYFGACLVFVLLVFGGLLRLCGYRLTALARYLREEIAIVAATTSSDAVLPQTMKKLEDLGVEEGTVGLVIPTGYSFNLDGFSLYLTLAVLFIAQATDTALSAGQVVSVLLIALLTSKGAHGVPGAAIVILAATLAAVPSLPVSGLLLLLPADWFVGIARALTNYLGNCVATLVVGTFTRTLDHAKARTVLAGEAPVEAPVAAAGLDRGGSA